MKLDSMPVAGSLNVKSIKSFIQDILGIKHETMTGEITVVKENGKTIYGVKIRQMPEDRILVDVNVEMPIKELIKLIALNIVESKDPAVAATYLRIHKQDQRALKMIDRALQDNDTSDDAYALTTRAHIYMRQSKYKLAQEDLSAALKLDPKFASAMALQVQLFLYQKKFSLALEIAKKEAEFHPDRWQTYINLGDSYEGLGDKDLAQTNYLKAISLRPGAPIIYIKVADYFNSLGKIAEADDVLHKCATFFPNDSATFVLYADILIKQDKLEEANEALAKAYELNDELAKIKTAGAKDAMLDKQALLEKSAEFKQSHASLFTDSIEDALDNDFEHSTHSAKPV
jgi:tetratricopeptide (TPR) repeat protein